MANQVLDELKSELQKNLSEIISAFFVVVIMLFLFYLRKNYIVSIIACGFIVILALEKRGSSVDRYFAMFTILVLTVAFMFV